MQSPVLQRHEAERRERIARILNAARKLLLRKGYAGTTMRDICTSAQLSTGAVYFYFSGKEEIYAAICAESFDVLQEMLEAGLRPDMTPEERLIVLDRAYLHFYRQEYERWLMLRVGYRNVLTSDKLIDQLEVQTRRALALLVDTVAELLRSAGLDGRYDSEEIALQRWASIEGLLQLHANKHLEPSAASLEDLVMRQHTFFLKGLVEK